MPKSYLTLEQRQRAAVAKKLQDECDRIAFEIKRGYKRKGLNQKEIEKKYGISHDAVSKALNKPHDMRLEKLRDICFAAGLRLVLDVEPI